MGNDRRTIVILGAGFAGIRCALDLAARSDELPDHRIVLIDKNSYHLFTPWLYERASTGTPVRSLKIPLAEIVRHKPIEFLRGEVTTVDRDTRAIRLNSGQRIDYEYLVFALGSVPNDYGIPGLNTHALPLKTYEDAETIRRQTRERFRAFLTKHQEGDVFQVVIGGGGVTGIELAAELHAYLKELSAAYGGGEDVFVVKILEASDRLLSGLPDWASRRAQVRLGYFRRIEVHLQNRITTVTADHVVSADGDAVAYDLLIWTGGVTPHPLVGRCALPQGPGGRSATGATLQLPDDPYTLAIGDMAVCVDPMSRRESLQTIQDAYRQGALAARNIINHARGKPLEAYTHAHSGLVVHARGRWAISTLFGLKISGWLPHIAKQIINLRYFLRILPAGEAFRRWRSSW